MCALRERQVCIYACYTCAQRSLNRRIGGAERIDLWVREMSYRIRATEFDINYELKVFTYMSTRCVVNMENTLQAVSRRQGTSHKTSYKSLPSCRLHIDGVN